MAQSTPVRPLSRYKVLDMTQHISGPVATRTMAENGAEVVKVEPPGGDNSRNVPVIKHGRSGYFVGLNRGKKSLCVDVKTPAGLAIIKALLPRFDVLVENFAPGVIGRLGLGYDVVKSINPAIIMCSISSFGQTGPLAAKTGYDYVAASYAGVINTLGFPDSSPVLPGLTMGDSMTAISAYGAILTALIHREQTGEGQFLDICLLDSYFQCWDLAIESASLNPGGFNMERSGRRSNNMPPIGIFKSERHYICVMAPHDHFWPRLCKAIGRQDLASDLRFTTVSSRARNSEEVFRILEEWFAATPEDEALRLLDENRVPVGPVLTVAEAMEHPHLRERGTVRKIHDRILGDFDHQRSAMRFSAFPQELALDAPFLGEHNAEILRGYLGYTDERIAELEASAVLHNAPY
jgi:crotonobetainyl-CoA:carnitine CoA-transferase CaiB-like acyl-CoA transferase